MQEKIQPVLLGADLNCYSMARAFFYALGVPALAYGQMPLGATQASRYLRFSALPTLGRRETLRALLCGLARRTEKAPPP